MTLYKSAFNFYFNKGLKHALHYLLPHVKETQSQKMALRLTYPYQRPLGKATHFGQDFVLYCVSEVF